MEGQDVKGERKKRNKVRKHPDFILNFLFDLLIPECLGFFQF